MENNKTMENNKISKEEFEKIRYELAEQDAKALNDDWESFEFTANDMLEDISDEMVNEEIKRRQQEKEETKKENERKREEIEKRPWTHLFSTKLIDLYTFRNKILENARQELKNNMKNIEHGFFLTQKNEGYEKLIKDKDGNKGIDKTDEKKNRKERDEIISAAYTYANQNRKNHKEILYYQGSKKLNDCQIRAAIVEKQLRDEGVLRGQLNKIGHTQEFTCNDDGRIILAEGYLDNEGELEELKDKEYALVKRFSDDLEPMMVVDDTQHSDKIGTTENAHSENKYIPAGIYELALSRYLLKEKPKVGEKFLENMLDDVRGIWAFSGLPGLQLKSKCILEKKNIRLMPFLLLSSEKNSFVPGQTTGQKDWTYTGDLKDYARMKNPENSNYTLDFVTFIKTLNVNFWFVNVELQRGLLRYIQKKFPHSKVLYINMEYYGKNANEVGLEEKYYQKTVYDWMTNAIDGKFVLMEESLEDYIKSLDKYKTK